MARQAANHRLHDNKPLLGPSVQRRGAPSEDGKEEGRAEGAHQHPCQRGGAVRREIHLRGHERQHHAQALQLRGRGHPRHRQGVYRLCEVCGADTAWRHLRHQDEEEPRLRYRERRDDDGARRPYGVPDTACGLHKEGQRRRDRRAPCTHHHIRGHQEVPCAPHPPPHQRHGHGCGGNCGHLPPEVGDRAALQAAEAELPAEILLRGERQRHKDPDMGDPDGEPPLMVVQRRVSRPWNFSGLATIVRIMLMYYVNIYSFLEDPEKDWAKIIAENEQPPPQPTLFDL